MTSLQLYLLRACLEMVFWQSVLVKVCEKAAMRLTYMLIPRKRMCVWKMLLQVSWMPLHMPGPVHT